VGAIGRKKREEGTSSVVYRVTPGRWGLVECSAALAVAEEGLRRAEMGRWPAPYAINFARDALQHAGDSESFIAGLTAALRELQRELRALEDANSPKGRSL
jgi:hypothetical protein